MGAMTAKNTFGDGLLMDFAPDNTQATCLSNALNATLVTMNGNELSLLNDMGNGRVESALLPLGYVPVGTCEFGGIIYIASYNPLTNKSQIGCFPSPERNLDSTELNGTEQTISKADFFSDNAITSKSVKKVLIQDTKLNPGDKYIIYVKGDNLSGMLSDYGNTDKVKGAFPKILKLSIVSIEDSGKINYIDSDTRWYNDSTNCYYLLTKKENNTTISKSDIDSYQSAIKSAYNVFSSKVSGKLAILAELETIDSFSCSLSVYKTTKDSKDVYNVYVNTSWETSNNDVNPSGIHIDIPKNESIDITYTGLYFIDSNCTYSKFLIKNYDSLIKLYADINTIYLKLDNGIPNIGSYITNSDTESTKLIDDIIVNNYFKKDVTKLVHQVDAPCKDTINYDIYPVMPYGKLTDLKVSTYIDFSKIGTGEIKLTLWKYYKYDSYLTLTFGLEIYEEQNKGVSKVTLEFYNYEKLVATLEVTNKNSYFGTFTYNIPLDTKTTVFKGDTDELESNLLYGVKIKVYYQSKDSLGNYNSNEDPITFIRYLWTNSMYNEYYYSNYDFDELPISLELTSNSAFKSNITNTLKVLSNTSYRKNLDKELIPYYSLSYVKLSIEKLEIQLQVAPELKNNYGTFEFNNAVLDSGNKVNVRESDNKITITDTHYVAENDSVSNGENCFKLIKPLEGEAKEDNYPTDSSTKDAYSTWADTLLDSFSLGFSGTKSTVGKVDYVDSNGDTQTSSEVGVSTSISSAADTGIPLIFNGCFYSKATYSTYLSEYNANTIVYRPFIQSIEDLYKYNIIPAKYNTTNTFAFDKSRYMITSNTKAQWSAGDLIAQSDFALTYILPEDANNYINPEGGGIYNIAEIYSKGKIDTGIFSQVDYGTGYKFASGNLIGLTALTKTISKTNQITLTGLWVTLFGYGYYNQYIKAQDHYFNKNTANKSEYKPNECSLYLLIIKKENGDYLFLNAFARGIIHDKARSLVFGSTGDALSIVNVSGNYSFADYVANCLARIYYRDATTVASNTINLSNLVICSPYTETWSKDFIVNFNIKNLSSCISVRGIVFSDYLTKLNNLLGVNLTEDSTPRALSFSDVSKLTIVVLFKYDLNYNVDAIISETGNVEIMVLPDITGNVGATKLQGNASDIMYIDIENETLLNSYKGMSWHCLSIRDDSYTWVKLNLRYAEDPLSELVKYLKITKDSIYANTISNGSSLYLRLPSVDGTKEMNYFGFNGALSVKPFNLPET